MISIRSLRELLASLVFTLISFFVLSCSSSDTKPQNLSLKNAVLVGDGNSLMFGIYINGTGDILTLLSKRPAFTSDSMRYHNLGVGAQTTQQMIADMDTEVLPLYDPETANVLLFLEGGNDLYANGNVESAYQNILTYVRKARTKGFRVIIFTLFARDQKPEYSILATAEEYEQKIRSLNTLILQNPLEFDGIVDSRSIPSLASSSAITLQYYQDRIHLTQQGYALLVDKLTPILLNLDPI